MSNYGYICHSELYHHGIKGMKWGVRRYQNEDGSLTPEGMKRYSHMTPNKHDSSITKKVKNDWYNLSNDQFSGKYKVSKDTYSRRVKRYGDPYKNAPGPKIAKALNKSGISKVANTVNRKTGATKLLTKGIQNVAKDPKKFYRNAALAAVGPLAVASLIGGGALIANKKNHGAPSNRQIKKKINESLENGPEIRKRS